MAQKTNLNINPYFDDFDADKNFYKVLFNPGRPIQSRELNTIQSILQNQVETFGSHIFKEGSKVIPGGIHYDSSYHAVKLNTLSFGVEISQYLEKYIGKKIRGQTSGLTATVKSVVFPNNQVSDTTIYVKYLDSDNGLSGGTFLNGESLLSTEIISYGINNITISSGSPFASLISSNATDIGSVVSIDNGIYFIRGNFVSVSKQSLILEYYSQFPSYRIGLNVSEEIITAKEDRTLYDNAKGFNNFSSPGADRFKINLSLTKKQLTDLNDTNFVELLRVEGGILRKTETETDYNLIKDYLAKRTYDESGNYTVDPFSISLSNSLNDLLGNNGKYLTGKLTSQENTPSDDLMCLTVSPGKAYVKGYDVHKTFGTVIDVDKPRDTQTISDVLVPFDLGNILKVNNVYGCPTLKGNVDFYDQRRDATTLTAQGEKIGDANVYLFKVTDAAYTDSSTSWDLHVYDSSLFTELTLGTTLSSSEIKVSSKVVGQASGAIGYAVNDGSGSAVIKVRVESGRFVQNEIIHIDGIEENKRNIKSLKVFSSEDIKSVVDTSNTLNFFADVILKTKIAPGYTVNDSVSIERVDDNSATLTSTKGFSGIKAKDIVKYTIPTDTTETFNRVSAVNTNSLTLVPEKNVSGVNSGTVPGASDGNSGTIENVSFKIGISEIENPEKGYLYSILPNRTIETVDLSGSQLTFTSQITGLNSSVGGDLLISISTGDFNLPNNSGTIKFDAFDAEKYSIHYSDGVIEPLTQDKVVFTNNFTTVTFNNIQNKTIDSITASFVKSGIQSKTKVFKKSETLDVSLSKYKSSGSNASNSSNDGLTYNRYYGLRVQDEEICLRYPDVARIIAVYEELDGRTISLDTINFSSIYSVGDNVLIGEEFEGLSSQSVARVIGKTTNSVTIAYLNSSKFQIGENVKFRSTNTDAIIESITPGSYTDITSSFKLDKGHKDEYYDYSRLIRINGEAEPSRKIKIIFDRYDVNAVDNGDLYSVLSYDAENYGSTIPRVGRFGIKASDILDFRPRVSYFSSSTSSPFSKDGRSFGNSPKVIITPNEATLISYDVYLPRIDKLYLDSTGTFALEKGISSLQPKAPKKSSDLLELATILLPPYLFDISDARISMVDNKRYTMRDIGLIQDRVEILEEVTSLSLLELNTQALQIKDSDGFDRFKTGFFADSFNNNDFIDVPFSFCEVNQDSKELTPLKMRNVVPYQVLTESNIGNSEYDSSQDYTLLDNRVKKTGNVVTLNYTSREWIKQELATRVSNVNPFHVIQYVGDIRLNPFEDIWIRTVQLDNKTLTHSLSLNLESSIQTETLNLGNLQDNTTGNAPLGLNQYRDTFTTLNLSDANTGHINKIVTSDSDSDTSSTNETTFVDSEVDQFMRSRNTEFSSSNLKASTRYYASLDGISNIDITPKLIEIAQDLQLSSPGSDGVFEVGENISVWDDAIEIMRFRLAESNHKSGAYNSPNRVYDVNPYSKNESMAEGYSQSSTTLNIDTLSLSDDSAGEEYGGYLVKGAILIGETSGAIAYVKDIRLVTDNYGDIIGTFFIREPHENPVPAVRVPTGNKTFRLSSSEANSLGIVGSTDISSAETTYSSRGTVNKFQNTIRVIELTGNLTTTNQVRTRTLTAVRSENISNIQTPTPVINNITNVTQDITEVTNVTNVTRNVTNVTQVNQNITQILQQQRHDDPLAQTFLVGTARGLNSFNDDELGAFLTSIDLFFASVDSGNAPITIQLRTTEFGIPTLTMIGDPVTLRPTDKVNGETILRDNISIDGTVATKVTFPYPIYLPPGLEYAIVLMAPESDEYEVFTAKMGENTLSTANLPDAESVRYTQQFAIGSLFKSQNGSTWTPDQYEDMKFTLYKAEFTSTEGIAYLGNTPLSKGNSYVRKLTNNPLTILPRKLKVGIDTITDAGLLTDLTAGRKIQDTTKSYVHGIIESVGGNAHTVSVDTGGRGYSNGASSSVSTFNITGNGSGLTLNVNATNGIIDSATPVSKGKGYAIGDVVGIVTSDIAGSNFVPSGENSRITITSNNSSIDTLYLTNVAGDSFTNQDLVYYNNGGSAVSLANTHIQSSETYLTDYYDGTYALVNHFDHGMYAANNIVSISAVSPDTSKIKITSLITRNSQSINVSSLDISLFQQFEGVDVSNTNPGYLIVNSELMSYTSASGTEIGGVSRGLEDTIAVPHPSGTFIQKYECGGVSLRRINTKHNIVDTGIDINSYYIKIPIGSLDIDSNSIAVNRNTDGSTGNNPALSFNKEKSVGGTNVYASENVLYDTVTPFISAILPPESEASISAQLKSVSATSVNGNETSFLEQPYVDVELNQPNKMNSLSMVTSKVNTEEFLSNLLRSKSSVLSLSLSTTNYNLSPMIFLDTASAEYTKYLINNPISDYISDKRTSNFIEDPHAAVYISKTINLARPSNTLRVNISAYRHKSADFRVMYSLIKPEMNTTLKIFEMFPGYNNLTSDLDSDGFLDIVDASNNSGLPDTFTSSSADNEFIQYQYTAPNVGPFVGFTIKIVMSTTKMDKYPRFKDIRAIALL